MLQFGFARTRLVKGASANALQLWFAQTLRVTSPSLAGYRPLLGAGGRTAPNPKDDRCLGEFYGVVACGVLIRRVRATAGCQKTYLSLPTRGGVLPILMKFKRDRVLKLVIASSKRIFSLWVNAFPYVNER